ncbi:MAG: hypothetical protein WCV67_16035 [Victivallaceae bacterium]|jgi:epoxyqueuosine reductase QueG
MNAAQVKNAARSFGANLVGIAPMERLEYLPPETNPRSIFPYVKSVIVIGRRILRGALRGVEEGTNFGSTYSCFGDHYLESQFLSKTVYELTCYLEKHNIESVPMLGYKIKGEKNSNVILDYKVIAQAAGLGETGKGGFFLTSEYGHRQRLAMILVDEAFEWDELKTLSLCANCKACSDGCPLNAVNADEKVLAGLQGHETKTFVIDNTICRLCKNGAGIKAGASDDVDRYAAACGRACLVALENKVSNKFENKFRKRSVWSRDISGTSTELSFVGGQAPVNK